MPEAPVAMMVPLPVWGHRSDTTSITLLSISLTGGSLCDPPLGERVLLSLFYKNANSIHEDSAFMT